jgi:diguanylate cyclase (GGDEF)-like protein
MDQQVLRADSAQILVVDDNNINLKLLTDILTRQGYNVRPASSGQLALRSLEFETPDLILLDINMPGMDGYEVCQRLKANECTQRIPVIFISALDEVADKVKSFHVGGVDYITKPFQTEEVLARVNIHLALDKMQKHLELQNAQLIHEISERKQAERMLQEANEKLSNSVKELEERTTDMSQLSEMGEQLQNCQTIEEVYAISAQYLQKLFPADQGAIYLIGPAKDRAEAVKMWGDSTSMAKLFEPLNCWAIRRGRPHLVDDSHPGLLCRHTTSSPTGQYLCVPMLAHGKSIGILHLNHTTPEQNQQKSTKGLYSEHKPQLALAAADHIAMAINNLKLQEALRQQAIRDILTGLFNRRYMEESLRRELNQAERAGTSVGVIMFDIDHFKHFNDLFGHDGGDALLRELGAFLNTHTREGDIVSRYGGEEFVLVLPGATLEAARFRAEELRLGVSELQVFHQGKPLGKITLSFGVAVFPEHALTKDNLLKSADIALYRAKKEGRDRVVVATIETILDQFGGD